MAACVFSASSLTFFTRKCGVVVGLDFAVLEGFPKMPALRQRNWMRIHALEISDRNAIETDQAMVDVLHDFAPSEIGRDWQ